jgi:hypothetical protein
MWKIRTSCVASGITIAVCISAVVYAILKNSRPPSSGAIIFPADSRR